MTTIPVRLRVGCHVTTLGDLEANPDADDPEVTAATYARLAGLLEDAAADLRERVIPEVVRDGGRTR